LALVVLLQDLIRLFRSSSPVHLAPFVVSLLPKRCQQDRLSIKIEVVRDPTGQPFAGEAQLSQPVTQRSGMGHRELWPDLAEPVKRTVGEGAITLYQRDVPVGDLLREFDLPTGEL
jgi:hypothetical protein